jgi:hypothetical protein
VILKGIYLFVCFTAPFSQQDLPVFKHRSIDGNESEILKALFQTSLNFLAADFQGGKGVPETLQDPGRNNFRHEKLLKITQEFLYHSFG